MDVIFGLENLRRTFKRPVVAIGVFDGLHVGHQHLIRLALKRARAINGVAMVMTFSPHPVQVLHPNDHLQLLISLKHRLKLIEQMGVDICVVVRFSKKFSRLSPEIFIRRYLVEKIKVAEVIVGDDFRFGKDRAGTFQSFRKSGERYGFKVHAIKALQGGKKLVGSSKIRALIVRGRLQQAARFLCRPPTVDGLVVRGDGRGRKLGFPTVNIHPKNIILPPTGVYVVQAIIAGKKFSGVANVGRRPSFVNDRQIIVEVHVFDFMRQLYGQEITVEFLQKIRAEKKFQSQEKLIAQIKRDVIKARRFFISQNNS